MELTTRERRRLGEIEGRLTADEPRLDRALSTLSTRPLRAAWLRAAVRATLRRPRLRLVLAAVVLVAGVALLVVGTGEGLLPVALLGIVTAQFGPWLVTRRRRTHRTPDRPLTASVRP